MAQSLTLETLLEEVQTKIKSLENLLADDWKVQRAQLAAQSNNIQYKIENKIAFDWREDEGIARGLAGISKAKTNAENQLAQLKKDEEILIRDIDERNRQLEKLSNMVNDSTLNTLKNINNEVIAQSMRNEDLRNNIIKGGVIVVSLALLSGIILKKKRSRK